jgi:putative transposase
MRADWQVWIRWACAVIRFDPRTYRYKSRRPGQAALEQRIREICQTRVRFGYRRVHVLLKREGWEINAKKTYRIYKELGMQLRNKTPKRRVKAKLRENRAEAVGPNDVWAMHCPVGDCLQSPSGTSCTINWLPVGRYVF